METKGKVGRSFFCDGRGNVVGEWDDGSQQEFDEKSRESSSSKLKRGGKSTF